jgi:hypothetical protein
MNVYIANFGSGNWAWPECLRRGAIAVMDDTRVHPYWQRGDRDGYIETAMRVLRTKKGKRPTRSVAARWYNVTTLLHETAGDLWVHREKDELWWTVSTGEQPEMLVMDDPGYTFGKTKIAVYYKQCQPWSQRDKAARLLLWAGIHPKAREFLFTEGTFQKLSVDNAPFAQALIDGADLNPWYKLSEWQTKAAKSEWSPTRSFSPLEIAEIEADRRMRQTAARMIKTAQQTSMQSGQEILSVTKDKQFLFPSDAAAQEYSLDLMKKQEGRCALTGLKMLLDDEPGDDQCRYSLDRIDSSRHYELGNLQVVCKFVNQWKGAMANEEFKRLIAKIRE